MGKQQRPKGNTIASNPPWSVPKFPDEWETIFGRTAYQYLCSWQNVNVNVTQRLRTILVPAPSALKVVRKPTQMVTISNMVLQDHLINFLCVFFLKFCALLESLKCNN